MILKYSKPKGIPYLEFDDGSKMIFSTLTEHPIKGFNWLAFSGKVITEFKTGGKGKKKAKSFISKENVNFITDMKFTEIPADLKKMGGPLSPVTLAFLKRTFKKLAPDGWFPRENLTVLESMIDDSFNHIDLDELDDDPELVDEDVVSK